TSASRSRLFTNDGRCRWSSVFSGSMTVFRVVSQSAPVQRKSASPIAVHPPRRIREPCSDRPGARQFPPFALDSVPPSTQLGGLVTLSTGWTSVATDDGLIAALDATVARARGSALYRERLAGVRIRSLDDLRALPLTTRADLQAAGPHGTRAVPLADVCHYRESSGTTGASNSTWLTAGDFARDAAAIRAAHPDVFAPGRVILNRFPFMAAPAHLIQLIAQGGGGVAIPAGNINWDVPFPRALELAERTA